MGNGSTFRVTPRVKRYSARKAPKGPKTVRAYHCGRKFDTFNLKHVGSGEGYAALGPGMYFTDRKDFAELYCKYSPDPYLYTVDLDTRGYYNSRTREPRAQGEKLQALENELVESGELRRHPTLGMVRDVKGFEDGSGPLGSFFAAHRWQAWKSDRPQPRLSYEEQARLLKRKTGVTGAIASLRDGAKEYAAFDTSTIYRRQRERMVPLINPFAFRIQWGKRVANDPLTQATKALDHAEMEREMMFDDLENAFTRLGDWVGRGIGPNEYGF